MIPEQYTNLFQNYLSSDEFINLEDDKKPLYVEGFRRDFIAKNNITDEKDINYINSESEKELADFRKTYNIPRFVPTQEQAQSLYGQIPQVDGTTEDKVKAIEDWRDNAKKNSASLLPANKEDLDYHVEEIANSNIRSILAKEDYKPGGAPDWLTDKTKRVAEAMIKPFYDLTNFKESQRFFSKNLVENPEFDQDLSSDFASGVGQLLTQTAISLGETAIGAPELIPYTFATLYGAQYMNDAYQDEMRKSGDETKAFDRAIGSIPAASLDTFSDAFLFHGVGKGVGNFGERFLKATTEAEKRAILKEAVPAIGKEMRTQFLSEGLIGGAGADVASNLGNYYATGDESYLKNASDVAALARSAFVEGTLGAVFGGAFEALGGKQSKENLSGIISSLTLQQTKSEDILKAIQEGDYNKVIEITKGKLITSDQYSELEKLRQQRQQPVSATNSDTAKAGAEALKGRVTDLRQIGLDNLKFINPLNILHQELSKDPEVNKEILERINKAKSLFYEEDGKTPKPFERTSEFENIGDINEFLFSHPNEKKGTVKRNEALEAKLQDGSTESGNNVIYINTSEITRNEKRDRFLDNLNFFHILGENPALQQSKGGRYVTFKGTDGRVYEASPNPKKGYTPIQITDTNQDGKISRKYKILSQVTEVVEKQQTEQPKQTKPQDVQFEQEFDSRLAAERFIEKNKTTVFNTSIISEPGKKDRLVYRKTDNNITFPNEKPFNQQTTQQANDKPTTEEEQFFTDSTPTKTDDTTGLKQLFSDLGSSVTKGLYEKIFKELQAGDLSDPVAFHAKEDFDKGLIKSPDDLKTWVDNNYDRKLNETKNKSVAPENTAPEEESIDQTTIDQTADNLNKDKKEEDKVVAPIVKKPRKRLKKKEEIVEEPKVEESKTEEPKQEEPKQEEPKAEEPKTVDEAIKKAESNPQWTLASLKASAEFQREIMRNDPDGQKRKSAQEKLRIINDQIKELEQKPTNEKNAESKKLYFEGLKKLLDQDKLDASKIQEDLKNGVITEEDLKDFAIDNEFIYSGNLDKFISDWKTYSEAAQQAKVEKVLTQREQQIKDKVEADRRRKAQKGRIYELARDVGLGRLAVLNSHEELDKKVGVKASATDQAFVVNGHVYILLDNIIPHKGESFVQAAERIFKHEVVGHLKMSKVLSGISPEGFKNLVTFLKTLKYQNGESVWEEREKLYTTESKKPSDEEIVDEVFAKIAEQRNKTSRGLIQKIMNWIRINFLKSNTNANWTQQDIEIIVEEAFHQELNDKTEKAEKTEIAKKAEKAYNSIEEYIINDDKRGTLSAIKKAHKDGLISDGVLEEAIRLSKDKDMGAEDLKGSGVLEELTDKFDNNIRYSKSIKSLHLNSSMKGVYGAWITPTGQIDEVPHQDHFGYALEKIGEENATSVDQVYNELYNRGYLRAVNTPDGVFVEGHKLTSSQRAALDFIGINDEKNVKFNNKTIYSKPSEIRFSRITPEQDQQYLKAVESGDMKTAQEMVDEAAKRAGYNVGPVYHGSFNKGFNEFDMTRGEKGAHFGTLEQAITVASSSNGVEGEVRPFFLRGNVTPVVSDAGEWNIPYLIEESMNMSGLPVKGDTLEAVKKSIFNLGYSVVAYNNQGGEGEGVSYLVWNPSQIKLADPVVRDDNGNVIPLSERFNDVNNDIRFSKKDTKQEPFKSTPSPFASALESMQEDDLSRRQKTAIKQQINNLIKTKLEQKLIIGEKAIINSFRAIDPRFLSDTSLTQMLDDLTNFVDTRTRQEEPLESRTPIIELQNRLAAFKIESDLNEFKNYKKTAPGVIFGDFSDYNNNIGQVRALVMEASAAEAGDFENRLGFDDEDINYTNLIEEMQYDVLDRINNDSESINQPFVQARAEVKMTGDPILDRGAEMILNRINQIEKLRNEFILHLVTTDPTDLTKRERRQLYYSLMSLTTDGYPNGIMNFVSNNITNLLKVTEFKFRTPYSTKVSGRVSKLESAPAQIRRLATDDASHQALIQLIAPFREGLFNARRYHETVITPYLEAQFQSIFGVKTLPAKELNKIGIFSHLRQHFVSEKPSEGLKSSIEWLMKSLDNANIYDKTFRDTAEANREYLKGMIDGIDITWKGDKITNELTDDDVRKFHENAKMIIGEKGIAYADAVVKLFDALKPLSKLTTEYSYGRQFDEIVNFVPSMSIIMKGPEGSEIDIGQYRFLTDNKAIRDGTVGYRSINTTGSSVTKDRMRSLNDNRSLILNLNYLADSVGRLAVYDFFTSFERRDIQRILTPRSKEGKMMAEFLGDKEGRLGKSQTLRNALETMWQNVMSQSSYMHPFHSGVNWLTRKFAQSKLSSIHQVFSQTISNTIPFFVQNLANPKRIGNYVKALQFYAKFKAGALNDPILNNTIAKIVFEIQHRHQENWLDKSVNLNDRGMGVEWVKENFPKVYSGLAASDKFIENGLLGMFRISDSLSGVPMMLAEYLSNEQIRLNRPNLQFEDLVYNPETYVRSLDEVERFLGIGDNSRRGEYLTNRNASISLARNLLISFRSFAIGNATNFMAEYQKLTSSDMSTGDKMKSLRYMGGIVAQSVAFTGIKVGVQLMIGQAIMNALKDKDDDKELKDLYRRSQNKMSKEERRILDAEISMRQKIRKALEVNKRNEDNRILFINTAKDAASNMFLWTNLDFITEGMIHIGSDKFEEAAFNEIKAGEVKNLQDLIKRNKQYNNKSIVARLKEQLDQLNSQEFLSASFEDRGYGMLGGSFGGTAKGILDAIESASVFFEPKGISAKDMMNIGSALGMSQPDLLKMVRVMDKIQKANDERDEKIKARLQ